MANDHKKIIAKYSTVRPENKVVTPSVELLHDFMDAVRPVPPVIDEQHYMRLKRVASFLGLADDDDSEEVCAPEPVVPVKPMTLHFPKTYRKSLDFTYRIKKLFKTFPAVYRWDTVAKDKFIQDAASAISQFPVVGQPIVPNQIYLPFIPKSFSTIVNEMKPYVEATGLSPGAANESARAIYDSQIAQSHRSQEQQNQQQQSQYAQPGVDEDTARETMTVVRAATFAVPIVLSRSTDATGTSTANLISSDVAADTPKDMLSIRANQEFIRRKKLEDAKASSDFRLRRPSVMFVSDFMFAGSNKGQIIGWRKVPQAAGYIVKRINIVTGRETSFTLFNEELAAKFEHISSYVRMLASFYDFAYGNVVAFLDDTVTPNSLYVYKVTAFQTFVDSRTSVFISPLANSVNLSAQQRKAIIPGDSVYPALADRLLGDRKLDWILAGVNIRASISRRDDRSVTRKYAYLDAKPDFIFSQMDSGKLLVPYDVGVVVRTISNNISSFGVVNVLTDVLRDTGILYTFEGIDPAEDGEYTKPKISSDETRFLGIISSAIDADTMLVNLRTLVTNLTKFLGGGISDQKDTVGLAVSSRAGVKVLNVDITDRISPAILGATAPRRDSELGNLDDIVDLHTFEGFSRLIRTIRIVSDLGPSRT
jgi:hypothetical protein